MPLRLFALVTVLAIVPMITPAGPPAQAAGAVMGTPRDAAQGGAPGRAPGVLRGRVDIRRGGSPVRPRPRVAELGPTNRPEAGDVRRAVVYLEALDVPPASPLRTAPAAARAARIDQRNETFVPGVLSINAGSVVEFPNSDQTFHNVFSLSKVRRFDLGRYGRGKSQSVRFDRAGVVRVFCDIHSHMSASVLVFNHPYHATTDDEGRYEIGGIPPGTYTVEAWHDGSARDSHLVTIPASGGVVALDLLVR